MGKRRLTRVAMSDDEDDAPPPSSRRSGDGGGDEEQETSNSRRKRVRIDHDDEEEEEVEKGQPVAADVDAGSGAGAEGQEEGEERNCNVEEEIEARPLGDVVRVSGKGKAKKNHYSSFEYDGNQFDIEDSVLLVPAEENQKPYVAIIKDITEGKDGLMVSGQWFYRPEEAEKRGGGNWQSQDTRELFYSFHRDDIPAESVMHKCVVHFIPLNKQIPKRKQHPGFIVQKVYDTEQKRLFKLTDKDYEDNKQHEIDLLVQKTMSRLGELPDIEPEDAIGDQGDQEDPLKNKRAMRRRNMSPLEISREDDGPNRSGQSLKVETPVSCPSNASEHYMILYRSKVLPGETQRDKWLEKLLQAVQSICIPVDNEQGITKEKAGSDGAGPSNKGASAETKPGSPDRGRSDDARLWWPETAVRAVVALERAVHEALSSDFQKYNQKMRQLAFNLKNTPLLARRLLKGELEPSKILNMSPNELKEALTAEEIGSKEPEESHRMQMTDARCKRCSEKKVGLIDIIQAGHGERYQLECTGCGNTWYSSRDEASTLTIEAPSSARNVGAAPLATAKFEDVEKKLVSPRGGGNDVLKKTTEAYMPVLDKQKSFNKKAEENTAKANPT